eukprot:8881491-Heterocapsa_arctica.AAC.1
MTVVELPRCLHAFHLVCARALITGDDFGPCPLCRVDVEWYSIATTSSSNSDSRRVQLLIYPIDGGVICHTFGFDE